jgi:hypothetical protein
MDRQTDRQTEICSKFVYMSDPYHWAWTPMAQKSFSKETVNHILPKLSDEDSIESLVRELHKLFKCDKHFNVSSFDKQMAVMRGQVQTYNIT